jgi:type II secretory pathway pseudopilin PulG
MSRRESEAGFTMIATLIAMTILMAFAIVAVAAVEGDTHETRRDLSQKQAFEAAKAGIDDYAFHLAANTGYWAECTNVPEPNAVNQKGSTTKQRTVPGNTGAKYAIELLPAAGHTSCEPATAVTATASMIESGETLPGSFRIRSTGFSGEAKSSIVATFKPPSFLDYVYFTQRETLDPITYGFPNPSPELEKAYSQCSLTYEEGRNNKPIAEEKVYNSRTREYETEYTYCVTISFATGDKILGPIHTNDSISINGTPTLGRTSQDLIETSAAAPGWYAATQGSKPNFVGTFVTKAPVLIPPATNSQLSTIAQSQFNYPGQVRICLSGTNMTVGNAAGKGCTGLYSGPIPSNGVIYVRNTTCSEVYSPFTAVYPETSGCGNVYVKGSYSGQLTIAAQNNVIINGSITREAGSNGLLGLIANNFVRIYHPFCASVSGTPTCTTTTAQTGANECNGGENGAGTLTDPQIDAAILAIEHSIIVDHYDCGATLGKLNVEGALAQKFRGPVGTGSNTSPATGYLKNYVYDNRLHYMEPPSFIDPKPNSWVIGRETLG